MIIQKKISVTLLSLFIFVQIHIFAEPAANVREYTLENGMQIFLLEDSSDALVHIEYDCRAGFSSQTQNTCGFFKLYSRLIKNSGSSVSFSDVQCNADSSRYILTVTPSQTEDTLDQLSQLFFNPAFSEELLQSELTKMKNEVSENAETMSTYINAAIDSRVFSDAPWKHDSGIYPPLFKRTTTKTARSVIKDISQRWYIPSNSAIFITGNFNSERILITLKQTFGRFYTNTNTPVEKPSIPLNNHHKYVFHNSEISSDLTQIVIQYTMMNLEECDLLAATLNNDASTFKQKILEISELNIPGAEYIDVSSAHKKDSSRLIIQTLIQPPENKKLGIKSIDQAEEFITEVSKIPEYIDEVEFQFAKNQLSLNLAEISSTPLSLMNNLAAFWAFEPFTDIFEEDYELYPDSKETSLLMNQTIKITNLDFSTVSEKIQSEEPFIFVIINSKDYKANKKAYTQAGFQEITENNSSWYVQQMFKEVRDNFKPEETVSYINSKTKDNGYYEKNISQITSSTLSNGIKVISKKNTNSTGISLLLSIEGGKLNSASENGFEEVMINLMAGIIQKEIYKKMYAGLIIGNPSVTTQTDISTSSILIEFDAEDSQQICDAISNSIIYGEIAPAAADKAVSSKQYKKRLENGSAVNQLYTAAIKSIYGKSDYLSIFDTEKDVLLKTDYTSILQAYPDLLNASRYSVIITGNYDDELLPMIENSLSLFSNNGQPANKTTAKASIPKNKSLSVQLRHTFLTDIPAEKAGPQPAVLIPTTEFLDPVLYVIKAPESGTKESSLFNALLNYLGLLYQNNINSNSKFNDSTVTIGLPRSRMNFGTITVQNVNHTKEADSEYKSTMLEIENLLKEPLKSQQTLQAIKDYWTQTQLSETSTNSGTAYLLQKGFELFPENPKPEYYLEEYNYIQNATAQDFLDILDYFPIKAQLRVYSADGKE